MPYTDDPANVPADQVRALIGDTNVNSPELTDNVIAFLLLDENDDPRRAAARGAELLSAKFTRVAAEKRVGPLTLVQSARFTSKGQEYALLAKRLWNRAGANSVIPYAGGISITDKNSNVSDSDRVRPSFSRRGMHYPNSDAGVTSEEPLSPPELLP